MTPPGRTAKNAGRSKPAARTKSSPSKRAEATAPQAAALRAALLTWFDVHQRPLPWRATRDPYAIWISEVMLQQTQVAVVLGYYARFLERFPTVAALAGAALEDVLAAWKGLGYYTRARNLHRAAQALVAEHGGRLPSTLEALRALPGFGRYTAGAVASIAFGVAAPIVDGNVARIFSRLFAIEGAPGDRAREATLWATAEGLVPGERPGDLNQALMELGATVCLPKNPLCLLCPAQALCVALRTGRVAQLPPPKARTARKALALAVFVVRDGPRLLFARRADTGLFGGLWELPTAPAADAAEARLALAQLLPGARLGPMLATVERTLTHRDLTLRLYPVTQVRPFLSLEGYPQWKWATLRETDLLGISAAMQAVLAAAAL